MREEMVTKALMTEAFPTWALAGQAETLDVSALVRIAEQASDEYTRALRRCSRGWPGCTSRMTVDRRSRVTSSDSGRCSRGATMI